MPTSPPGASTIPCGLTRKCAQLPHTIGGNSNPRRPHGTIDTETATILAKIEPHAIRNELVTTQIPRVVVPLCQIRRKVTPEDLRHARRPANCQEKRKPGNLPACYRTLVLANIPTHGPLDRQVWRGAVTAFAATNASALRLCPQSFARVVDSQRLHYRPTDRCHRPSTPPVIPCTPS